ncbi:hypothetical protein ACVINW_006328 [Bradyrhizobium sp. USDA 4461]
MTGNDFIGPAVVAAIVSGIVTIAGFIVSNRTTTRLHSEKLKFDEALAEKKFRFDVDLAERKFRYDRELHDHKRRVEFGEDLLAAFYKMKEVITAARSPAAFGNEGASRPRQENEGESLARTKDMYFVPLERLTKHQDFISDFFSKRFRARAIFRGTEIDRAFQILHEVIISIQVSAEMLINAVGSGRRPDDNFYSTLEDDIWGSRSEKDKLNPKVNQAIDVAEDVLGQMLEAAANDSQ